MITPNGIFLETESRVVAPNTGTWSDLSGSTWANWTSYTQIAPTYLYYLLDAQDLGTVQDFCLTISTQANGIVDYYVYTSDTGAFNGEEVEHEILSESEGVNAFTARYFQVGLRVEKISDAQTINTVQVQVIRSRNRFSIDNVDTNDLVDGSTLGYSIPLPKPVSKITNIQITVHEVTPYILDVYVAKEPMSQQLLAKVTSKSAANPSFALVGIDGQPREGVVDILVEYLPEMYMDGNTLRVR
jgi:hypothetical protein